MLADVKKKNKKNTQNKWKQIIKPRMVSCDQGSTRPRIKSLGRGVEVAPNALQTCKCGRRRPCQDDSSARWTCGAVPHQRFSSERIYVVGTADLSSGDQLLSAVLEGPGPSQQACSGAWAGGAWGGRLSSCFDDLSAPPSPPNSGLRVLETETFCLYWIFEKFFQDYREAGKQQSLQRFVKILKISKQHLWCQSKGL